MSGRPFSRSLLTVATFVVLVLCAMSLSACFSKGPSSYKTMATCKAAGLAWNGQYCDSIESARAKALVSCKTAAEKRWGGMFSCSDTEIVISATIQNDAISMREENCGQFGGVWESAPAGSFLAGACHLAGQAMTANAVICLGGTGFGMNSDGSCSAQAASANLPFISFAFGSPFEANRLMSSEWGVTWFGPGVSTTVSPFGTVIKAP